MATHLALDDRLVGEAQKIGGKATQKATVTEALEEYISRRKQARVTELFGTNDRLRPAPQLQEAAEAVVKVLSS